MNRVKRRISGGVLGLGLATGLLLLLPLGHGARADHTGRLTLQSVQDHVDDLETALDGLVPVTCGDGLLDPGEACDGSTALICEDLGFFGGALACSASCDLDTSGCDFNRFMDRGLTVFDALTGLEWEKKTNDGTIHDVDNVYTWTVGGIPGAPPDGTAFTVFLPGLDGFAGSQTCAAPPTCESADGLTVTCSSPPPTNCWRLPEIDELETIVDLSVPGCPSELVPCIDPIFGPTNFSFYWSATTVTNNAFFAWSIFAFDGTVDGFRSKTSARRTRAVRGPLP